MSEARDTLRYFRIEAREITDELGECIQQLERVASPETVARMLRLAHTLKGAAGIVRQNAIAERAHALEESLDPFRQSTASLGTAEFSAVRKHADAIGTLVTGIDKPADIKRRTSVEDTLDVIRAETADVDALLGRVGEAAIRLQNLRAVSILAQRAGQVCEFSNARLDMPAASQRGNSGAPETLRELVGQIEQQLATGLDLAEREMRQVRTVAEKLRLLPCRAMLTVLERAARNAAHDCGKEVEFAVIGGDIRVDARVLFTVQRALVQLVRNAVAHGIEPPPSRRARDKGAAGRIVLEISSGGGQVSFVCRDDGAGFDLDAVREVARGKGLSTKLVDTASAAELLQTMFRGGFSTAKSVTEMSGRGVGLDIVRDVAAQLGGRLHVASEPGQGARIEIVVPTALSAVDAILVESGGAQYAIPLATVRRTVRLIAAEVTRSPDGLTILDEEGVMPLFALTDILAARRVAESITAGSVLILEGKSSAMALVVDRILGVDNIVVHALPERASASAQVSGFSLDAGGLPRLLLDADGLIASLPRTSSTDADAQVEPMKPILVIDDSLTTRALEQSILESAGYEVDQAMSAEEGLKKARARCYGLFLVDVEMPGMGGYAFVEMIRADPGLRGTPAILVSSRDAPEDRQRGLAAGANEYVVKGEFNQNRFLATIRNLLEAV